jgi:hypothetical protein
LLGFEQLIFHEQFVSGHAIRRLKLASDGPLFKLNVAGSTPVAAAPTFHDLCRCVRYPEISKPSLSKCRNPPLTKGRSSPLSATVFQEGAIFSVYSKHATGIELLLFYRAEAGFLIAAPLDTGLCRQDGRPDVLANNAGRFSLDI